MRYTKSTGGESHVSIRVIIRLTPDEVQSVRAYLKRKGEDTSDKAVREFVNSCTEYLPVSGVYDNEEDV